MPNIKTFSMHWMVCSVCYLGCMVVNINALLVEWRITERDYFQILLFRILSGIEPTILFIFRGRCCDDHFPCFGKYIFPQLQTCSVDCTVDSCSSNIAYPVVFNNFLVFNFPLSNFQQQFPFPSISIPSSFSKLYSNIN